VITVDRRLRWLLWAALVLLAAGLWAFVVRGADQPADPSVGAVPSAAPGDPARQRLSGFDETAITVDPGDGRGLLSWCLLAALDADQRSRGLMGVTDLQGYSGMAFVYDQPVDHSYYMRNTPMPLSIARIDGDGHPVSTADMAPCEDREGCPIYSPERPYELAIEVPQGGLSALGIGPGATVERSGSCAPTA
jgi:uncharacterized membrane protein (UPF0127 family)